MEDYAKLQKRLRRRQRQLKELEKKDDLADFITIAWLRDEVAWLRAEVAASKEVAA